MAPPRETHPVYGSDGEAAFDVTLALIAEVDHPILGHQRLLAPGVTLQRTPGKVCSPTPERGQHSDEILRECGYNAEDIARFHSEGVV